MSASLVALFCVLTRAVLNVVDRSYFKRQDIDVLQGLFLNALLPLFVAVAAGLCFGTSRECCMAAILSPASLFAAIGAQAAASVFSLSFRQMRVRCVAVSSKLADLLIPIGIFFLTLQFSLSAYIYAVVSVLVFGPILFSVLRSRGEIRFLLIVLIVATLVFQAVVNDLFQTRSLTQQWTGFLSFMVAVLFWRTVIVFVVVAWRSSMGSVPVSLKIGRSDLGMLCMRAALAFVSQAAFFFAITRPDSQFAWPLLNGGPLASSYAAHICLREPIERAELTSFGLFAALTLAQLFLV